MLKVEALLEFEKELKDLTERCESGAVIVVEGIRDRKSLEALGIRGLIVEASNKPADLVAEEVCKVSKDVFIFTDCDRSGLILKNRLLKAFECRGVIPDTKKSEKMLSLCRVKSVEALVVTYVKTLEFLKI